MSSLTAERFAWTRHPTTAPAAADMAAVAVALRATEEDEEATERPCRMANPRARAIPSLLPRCTLLRWDMDADTPRPSLDTVSRPRDTARRSMDTLIRPSSNPLSSSSSSRPLLRAAVATSEPLTRPWHDSPATLLILRSRVHGRGEEPPWNGDSDQFDANSLRGVQCPRICEYVRRKIYPDVSVDIWTDCPEFGQLARRGRSWGVRGWGAVFFFRFPVLLHLLPFCFPVRGRYLRVLSLH
ncbi:hypothetical protein TPAR_07800 [Tolypocladium paradoxum]|uniref:Uncharacterized protein n=1 Tax=Tolypocladium paradoxum TaxID=94208 RepID=A0A2S4KP59_9HYPO|nr:hypothetical protein TPAR_07800 [Tolypocladium paradoxum]